MTISRPARSEHGARSGARLLADQAFSRAAGAPLVDGNSVRLLEDARENYPAWLEAIAAARRHVHFENYIISDDEAGTLFADALCEKAQQGVKVRLIYDWFGSYWKASSGFWDRLRKAGVEVREYNPPHMSAPFGWISRDHRKMISVDGRIAFITGLCVGNDWVGGADGTQEPWRDTGVELRGPAVADVERAFAQMWALIDEPIPDDELRTMLDPPAPAGDMRVRIVAGIPATAGMFRLDQLIAAMARKRLWIRDAYFVATTPYVQALRAAALDGVDVRLLVPYATDLPFLRPLSRAGYRPLLKAGVRVFEWNGPMMHAKTAVADGVWARVGSTNLNIASWIGNSELDAVIENDHFGRAMEESYEADLGHSTEVVLDARQRPRMPGHTPHTPLRHPRHRGSVGRATAGAIRIGSAVGAAFTDRRTLEPVEGRLIMGTGIVLLMLAVVWAFFPRILAYPAALVGGGIALSLIWKGIRLWRQGRVRRDD